MKKWKELTKEEKQERIIHIGLIAAGALGAVVAVKSINRQKKSNEVTIMPMNKVDKLTRDPRLIFDNQVMTVVSSDFRPIPGDMVNSSVLPGFSYVLIDDNTAKEISKQTLFTVIDLTKEHLVVQEPDADNVYDYSGILIHDQSARDELVDRNMLGVVFGD